MNYKKTIIFLIIVVALFLGVKLFMAQKAVDGPVDDPNSSDKVLVGNDKDEHGCIGSAGYVWCEAQGECLRPWEDQWDDSCNTEEFSYDKSKESVACTAEAKTGAKICEDDSAVGRVASDCEFEKCPGETTK